MDIGTGRKIEFKLFTDADYANDPVDRKIISGYVTMLDGSVINYASRKQGPNAQSTTEAEYIAVAEGIKVLQWVSQLCDELGWEYGTPTLFGDNMASIYMTERPGKHSRGNHIENKYQKALDLVKKKLLRVRHVGTNDMVADVMTKGLGRTYWSVERSHMKCIRNQWEFICKARALNAVRSRAVVLDAVMARTWALEAIVARAVTLDVAQGRWMSRIVLEI
jgi:hypothetical protein